MMMWLVYPLFGALAGVIAGLLGVGGGIVIVPLLVFVFALAGFPTEVTLHMALATSLGSIIFTSASSARAHHQRGAVRWPIVVALSPGILAGTFGGTFVAARLSTPFLRGFFACFLFFVALQLWLDLTPRPTRALPGTTGMVGTGSVIGMVSSLVGIGGGTLSVPFMIFCNVPLHQAIGTSAAVGLPIAVAGTLGYVLNGLHVTALPGPHLGYLYLPALVGIAAGSMLTAPLGARLAHRLPVRTLKRVFAVFLVAVASRMAWGLLAG
jgi:uncharacterized membrane protein YfcA